MTILIVDDNPRVRRLLCYLLARLDARIVECEDGADAADLYARHLPDVVLMDVVMPRLDGLSATRVLRQRFPGARVVMVTDCDDEDVRQAAADAGACAFVPKDDLTGVDTVVLRVAAAGAEPAL